MYIFRTNIGNTYFYTVGVVGKWSMDMRVERWYYFAKPLVYAQTIEVSGSECVRSTLGSFTWFCDVAELSGTVTDIHALNKNMSIL